MGSFAEAGRSSISSANHDDEDIPAIVSALAPTMTPQQSGFPTRWTAEQRVTESPRLLQTVIVEDGNVFGGRVDNGQSRQTEDEIVDTGEFIYFILDIGFEAGRTLVEPTIEMMNELMCVINEWITDRVELTGLSLFRQDSDNPEVTTKSYHIDWMYDANSELPVQLDFYADVRLQDEEETPALSRAVFEAFDLVTEDIAAFITDYIWTVSQKNIFYYTNRLEYRIRRNELFPPKGTSKLLRSTCEGETLAPTAVSVTVSPGVPQTQQPVVEDTLEPTLAITLRPTIQETTEPPGEEPSSPATEEPSGTTPPATPTPGLGLGIGGIPGFEIPAVPTGTDYPNQTSAPELISPTQADTLPPETITPSDTPEIPVDNVPGFPEIETSIPSTETSSPSQSPEIPEPGVPETVPTETPTEIPPPPTTGFTSLPKEPVSFEMIFFWDDPEYAERQPNKQDVQEAMCKTRIYLEQRLKVATGTSKDVKVVVTNVGWEHSGELPDGTSQLVLNMTAAAMYETENSEEPVPPRVVVAVLYGMNEELLEFIRLPSIPAAEADRPPTDENGNYIFGERDDFVFSHSTGLTYQDYPVGTELPSGSLRTIGCGERIFQDPIPDTLGEPIDLNNLPGPDPTATDKPSNTQAETSSPTEEDGGSNAGEGEESITAKPENGPGNNLGGTTGSPSPGNGPADLPAAEPPASGLPTDTLDLQSQGQVSIKFIVSNLVFMTIPSKVNRSGIADAFPIFVDEVVQRVSREQQSRRLLRSNRRLVVQVQPGSAYVSELTRVSCGLNAHEDLACHEAQAFYTVKETDNVASIDVSRYTYATYEGIHDGTLYNTMKQETPDTPLFIGPVPAQSNKSDNSNSQDILFWALAGICVLLLCCIFVCCWLVLYQKRLYEDELQFERALTDDIVDENDKAFGVDHHHHYPNPLPISMEEEGEEGFLDEDEEVAFVDDYTDGLEFADENEAMLLALANAGSRSNEQIKEKDVEGKNTATAVLDDATAPATPSSDSCSEEDAKKGIDFLPTIPSQDTSRNETIDATLRDDGTISSSNDSEEVAWEDYDAADTAEREFPIVPPDIMGLQKSTLDNASDDEDDGDIDWQDSTDEISRSSFTSSVASDVESIARASISLTAGEVDHLGLLDSSSSSGGDDDGLVWEDIRGEEPGATTTASGLDDSSSDSDEIQWEDLQL